MSDYQIRFNVYGTGWTGHANVTFIWPGGRSETYGFNILTSLKGTEWANLLVQNGFRDGVVQREEFKLDLPHVSTSIVVPSPYFDDAYNFVRNQENLSPIDYGLFTNACSNFVQQVYELAGGTGSFGELFTFAQFLATASPVWMGIQGNPQVEFAKNSLPFLLQLKALDGIFNTEEVNREDFPACFAAGTAVRLLDGRSCPIENLRRGDVVASFHATDSTEFAPGYVTRVFKNLTRDWIVLSWNDRGETGRLVVTPGHRFLDCHGEFRTIREIVERDYPLDARMSLG